MSISIRTGFSRSLLSGLYSLYSRYLSRSLSLYRSAGLSTGFLALGTSTAL